MTGWIVKRTPKAFSIVLNYGRVAGRRKVKWIAFRPTVKHGAKCTLDACAEKCKARAEAEKKLASLIERAEAGTFVQPAKITVGELVETWFSTIEPGGRRSTVRTYRSIVRGIRASWLNDVFVQHLRPSELERFYAELAKTKSASTVGSYHAVIRSALVVAVRDRIVQANVAREKIKRKPLTSPAKTAKEHCWSADEASRFLAETDKAGPQLAAFYATSLDTGARKAEVMGLTWDHIDLDAGRVTVDRQLLGKDDAGCPVFGVTKTGGVRTVALSPATIERLRTHRRAQAELKLKNRTAYRDNNLVFATEPGDLTTPGDKLGEPMRISRLGYDVFHRLREAAGLKRVRFHALRHTSASLLLEASVPVRDVSDRLGHANAAMTLNVYAHAVPSRQDEYAARLGAVLFQKG